MVLRESTSLSIFISWPIIGSVFGGAIFVFLVSRNKSSITPMLGLLGFIIVLTGLSKILFAMGGADISEVAESMHETVLALFYLLTGIIFAGIPVDEHNFSSGKQTPLINKMIYLLVPIISIGIYLFLFILIISPISRK